MLDVITILIKHGLLDCILHCRC